MNTFFVETWGCQMNLHDSERLEGILRENGLKAVSDAASADVVLLNTCSVREKPVQKILSRIGELARLPNRPMVGVCGCVAQQEGQSLLERSRTVGFVLGPGQVPRVAEALRAVAQGQRVVLTGFDADSPTNFDSIFRKSSTRGMITAIEGCNEFCTFCVVPYTRGREVSRPVSDLVSEARSVAARGIVEIELLGQTINAYRCPQTDADFAELLEQMATVPGLERVRFVTSHPRHFSQKMIDVLARHRKVSRYLHLPFQAGSDRILKRMNRKYTRDQFIDLVDRIRDSVPEINLSTDVIVGFPGETEEDFAQTLEVLETVRFGQVYAFAFSPRPNTPAERYEGQVDEADKKHRLHRLFQLTDDISLQLHRRMVGSIVNVLIDGDSRKSPDDWQGRGEDNRVVNFPKARVESIGDIVQVKITKAGVHSLAGEMVGQVALPRRGLPVLGELSGGEPLSSA